MARQCSRATPPSPPAMTQNVSLQDSALLPDAIAWNQRIDALKRTVGEKAIMKLDDEHEYSRLWRAAREAPHTLYEGRVLQTPSVVYKGIFIRDEYLQVWKDVLSFYNTGKSNFATPGGRRC